MAPHSTCPLFLKVVLVCLPYTVTGSIESVEPSFSPTCSSSAAVVRSRSAWIAPSMICIRQRDRRSPQMPTWDTSYVMSPVVYDGRNDGNGAAGSQETGARGGEKGEQDNINCNSAEGGKESHNGGGGGSSSSSSNGSDNGSSVGGSSANGGKGDGGGSSGGGKYTAGPSGSAGNPGGGDGSGASALERQFAKPAAPRNGGLSEGLGKGTPSPSQRLRLQQENLEMRWRMAKKRDKTVCCRQCAGEGVVECRFCAGTGLFKIGSDLIVHPTSGRPPPCPVCKSKGEEVCTRCKGAGRIAAWLLRSERSGDLSGDRG